MRAANRTVLAVLVAAIATAAVLAPRPARALQFDLALTVGEGFYVVNHHDVYRGPFSLELVPSLGWKWFKFDLGLYATLEDLKAERRSFVFRPGARLTPPFLPLYLRVAFPLRAWSHFDWGWMLGLGADIGLGSILGIVIEADTFGTRDGNYGKRSIPLEFRVGARVRF